MSHGKHACALITLLAVSLVVPTVATGETRIQRFDGAAQALGTNDPLYLESHWRFERDGLAQHLVLYRCLDGQPFARKLLSARPDPITPDFDFVDARDGYAEGAMKDGQQLLAYVQPSSDATRIVTAIDMPRDAVVDAGFDAFVRLHWDALTRGDRPRLQFLIPARGRFLGFRLSDSRQRQVDGRDVLELNLGLDAWYAFAAPSLSLRYDVATRRLLQFRGLGTIRDERGKQIKVQVDFPPERSSEEAPMRELQQAMTQSLTARCTDS